MLKYCKVLITVIGTVLKFRSELVTVIIRCDVNYLNKGKFKKPSSVFARGQLLVACCH